MSLVVSICAHPTRPRSSSRLRAGPTITTWSLVLPNGSSGRKNNNNNNNNTTKYGQYCFQPIALESLGPINSDARQFLSDLGRRISRSSGDDRETSFLFQRISVLLFRFNSVLLHDGFLLDVRSSSSLSSVFYFWFFPTLVFMRVNNNNNNNSLPVGWGSWMTPWCENSWLPDSMRNIQSQRRQQSARCLGTAADHTETTRINISINISGGATWWMLRGKGRYGVFAG